MGNWRTLLLTGTTGFIAKELLPLLKIRGYKVYTLERYVTGRIEKVFLSEDETWLSDIRDLFALTKCVQTIKPDIVLHLGALTAVAYSYNHPQEVLETNLIGSVNLAELCMRNVANFQQFIFASTAEVYGTTNQRLKREDNLDLKPNSPYAIAKYAVEKYLTYMHEAYNFPTTIFRFFNSYGRKYDNFFIIERIISQMLKEKICKLGDPEPVRDFLYYPDQLNAYMNAIENPKAIGQIFNVSSGIGVSIKEVTEHIAKLTDFKGEIVWREMPRRPLDIMHLVGDNRKIRRILKVPTPIPLEEGLKKTIEWRTKNDKNY